MEKIHQFDSFNGRYKGHGLSDRSARADPEFYVGMAKI